MCKYKKKDGVFVRKIGIALIIISLCLSLASCKDVTQKESQPDEQVYVSSSASSNTSEKDISSSVSSNTSKKEKDVSSSVSSNTSKKEKDVSSLASSNTSKKEKDVSSLTSSNTSKKEKDVSSLTSSNTSKKVETVTLNIEYNKSVTADVIVEGKSSDGQVVWNYTTADIPVAQADCASEIGQRGGAYYFVAGGTVIALDVQSGEVLWKNSDFNGAGAKSAFTEDAIYMCGFFHPDLFIIDYNGNTIFQKEIITPDYFWSSKIEVDGDVIAITKEGSIDGLDVPKVLYVDKKGNLIENHSQSSTEEITNIFDEIPSQFTFSSGGGNWHTSITISSDGSFTGEYVDYNLGETGVSYPSGSAYICDFTGKFTNVVKIDDYTYSMQVDSLNQQGEKNYEYIEDGIKYTISSPLGFDYAEQFMLYMPGKPVSELPKDFLKWVFYFDSNKEKFMPDGIYGLYNVNGKEGFVGKD